MLHSVSNTIQIILKSLYANLPKAMLEDMTFRTLARTYWFAALTTIAILIAVGFSLGTSALLTVGILTILEVTFSADNAVINGSILGSLSITWQRIFMTVGVLIAVFIVRFALPIVIVGVSGHVSITHVIDLALHHTADYKAALEKASPVINAFGGSFLVMVSLGYFIDYDKEVHWISSLERYLGKLGRFDNITIFIMLVFSGLLYLTAPLGARTAVFLATLTAIILYIALQVLDAMMSRKHSNSKGKSKDGWAAFAIFLYLEILDASFSLDSVVGAFAITNNVILIMAGLGAGAVWVRAMTVSLVRTGALSRYIYLEHGAHWALGFLGLIMTLELYGLTFPEWFTGSIGLIVVGLSLISSKQRIKHPPSDVFVHE